MVTLKDIALKVGVDISTVSKVLQGAPIRVSDAKRDQILRTAAELNYQPNVVARGLRLRKSGAIAMVVPTTTNYLYPEIIGGAEDAADEHGYILFLVKQSRSDPLQQLTSVVGQGRVDGLLFADDVPEPRFLDRLMEQKVPFISLNRMGTEDRRYVSLNDEAGFALQARHLVSLGHKSIVFVAVVPQSYVARICQGFFEEALRGSESQLHVLRCDFGGDDCNAVADQLLALRPRPTAVAAASVLVASRLVGILRSRGVAVPEEISVIGYHDSPVAVWPPPGVTTVKMPSRLQGRRGVERLLEVIEGRDFPGEVLAEAPEILERGTCKKRE
ncbi:LacI family DNA-binding transcriptional regulator [Fimbriimonas ginsengisoli]|uniref:LacI-family protein transcriptional regulator n=1 Tax=Fimbriimonas ginsengisoli Gsoil 348 TaxID=661478 RepID=A0A068NPQ4_FIMGI|nr:LacI family DNA-binding transcriptional regulator [Fimbriimonas ginsengisoli]AIE84740.1 LacI-family protein transcriptional regulator [Fimbriimonas ginsengisoli Gsoil 348]